jgi:hypothetical protein
LQSFAHENIMTKKHWTLPVDGPLSIHLDASGTLTLEAYYPIAGQTDAIALRLVLTPEAAAALAQSIHPLEAQGIDLTAAARPATHQ